MPLAAYVLMVSIMNQGESGYSIPDDRNSRRWDLCRIATGFPDRNWHREMLKNCRGAENAYDMTLKPLDMVGLQLEAYGLR